MKKMARKKYIRPTAKGQVTLPISVRRALDIDPDTILDVTVEAGNIILSPLQPQQTTETDWETVVDFSELQAGGVSATELKKRLASWTKSKKRSAN